MYLVKFCLNMCVIFVIITMISRYFSAAPSPTQKWTKSRKIQVCVWYIFWHVFDDVEFEYEPNFFCYDHFSTPLLTHPPPSFLSEFKFGGELRAGRSRRTFWRCLVGKCQIFLLPPLSPSITPFPVMRGWKDWYTIVHLFWWCWVQMRS